MSLYARKGRFESQASKDALLRKLDVDVTRILRKLNADAKPPTHYSGAPDEGDAGGGGIVRATMNAAIYNGQTASATLASGGDVTVDGASMMGYAFDGDPVSVTREADGTWYVVSGGRWAWQGALSGALSDGSSASATDGTNTVTVYEVLGLESDIDSGTEISAQWNEDQSRWEVNGAGCS